MNSRSRDWDLGFGDAHLFLFLYESVEWKMVPLTVRIPAVSHHPIDLSLLHILSKVCTM